MVFKYVFFCLLYGDFIYMYLWYGDDVEVLLVMSNDEKDN